MELCLPTQNAKTDSPTPTWFQKYSQPPGLAMPGNLQFIAHANHYVLMPQTHTSTSSTTSHTYAGGIQVCGTLRCKWLQSLLPQQTRISYDLPNWTDFLI